MSAWNALVTRLAPAQAAPQTESAAPVRDYWWRPTSEILEELQAQAQGLTSEAIPARRARFGKNEIVANAPLSRIRVLVDQLKNPLLLLLVFAAIASGGTGEWIDAWIILVIVVTSLAIGYFQEYRAARSTKELQERIRAKCQVERDGETRSLGVEELVPGDVVILAAGSLVPADCLLLEARDLHVSESVLTGESFPVAKQVGIAARYASLAERTNCLFLGTNVRSGYGRALVVVTGKHTQFGAIAERLKLRSPETEFERGTKRFGYLLTFAMVCMVAFVLVGHVLRGRPPVETLLFAIALAVGLSPELLPAILSVNLARGAQAMAKRGVLVRHLSAIENLGSMDVLCTDKTGTLTEGVVRMAGAYGADGAPAQRVLVLAAENAALESGIESALDEAIVAACNLVPERSSKLGEIPFDFTRKRVSVIVHRESDAELITKGAFESVLSACTRDASGAILTNEVREGLLARYREFSTEGTRVLAVATRRLPAQAGYVRDDEHDLAFQGFLTFLDRPKEGVHEALGQLAKLGVKVKLITGDSKLVAQHVARAVGLDAEKVVSGRELTSVTDEALWHLADQTDLFVEVDPNQKERIILAMKKMGHVVGFLGDGVNDAPAMHAADTSLSVEGAVDVAREAADFVLLRRDLSVIHQGIVDGRTTFANTLKYVLTTTSANLGNMVSMAVASLFLPFLPLLASQILLNNLLSDIPAVGIASDSVDPELLERPRRWNMRFIGRFMVAFGLVSSAFDLLTFGLLLTVFHASAETFRTAWFVESLLTELVIALVVRTRRPCWQSKPGTLLMDTTVVLILVTLVLPYVPTITWLGFVPLSATLLLSIVLITAMYVLAAELVKRRFYRRPALVR